ncbi:MAG: DUF308 domain-containing protein [Pseudomonadota bacterium]|nr:DUF308 domain-containing protein [Pseudomonadota bacterium]
MGVIAAIVGAVLILWPGTGAVAISWVIAAMAFLVGALMIFLGLRLRRVEQRVGNLGMGGR